MDGPYQIHIETPVGPLVVEGTTEAVTRVSFVDATGEDSPDIPRPVEDCRAQLEDYFNRCRDSFDTPLSMVGTPFQLSVWEALRAIPYGQTRSYGEVAHAIGRPNASRAVGGACRANPIGVVVPCHRVLGAKGDLVGFGGNRRMLDVKEWLLTHEAQDRPDQMVRDEGESP